MSLYSVNILADHFVVSAGSKTTVDALGKAYELGGKVEVKVDPGGGTKRYFGVVRLDNGSAITVQDGDYLIRSTDGFYTGTVTATIFAEDYTLVDQSS